MIKTRILSALIIIGTISGFISGYQQGRRAPATAAAAADNWGLPGYIEIVDGRIIRASNVHVRCTSGAFGNAPQWTNVVIQPYQMRLTNAWDTFSPSPLHVFASNGIVHEATPTATNIIGVTVRLCAKCNGRRFLKHDDFKLPNGEIVARDVTCSRCQGEGVEGP